MYSGSSEMFDVAEACIRCRCGCCKDECPMYSEIVEESISPKGRNILIRAIGRGVVQPDERAVRIAYSCLLCKRDEFSCSAHLKNAEATEAFREYLVSKGVPMLPEHELLVRSLENYGNPWQESKSARKRWAKGLRVSAALPGKTEVLFYVGCTFALDRSLHETPKALARLMDLAGESYGVLLEDELCCGSTAKRIGQRKLFESLMNENEARIRRTGAKRVVTACSGCYKTLKQDYPNLDKDVRVVHSTEYLSELVESKRLSFSSLPHKVTYHDPCHLGRHAEVYDAPRRLLRAIPDIEIVEMRNSRERSRCCGGGAGVKTAYPEISHAAAKRRIKEAEQTGASLLVTACPFCVQTLRTAAEATGSKVEIVELTVLLSELAKRGGAAA
jgi:heterodisulfide reductase subunit D